MYPSLCLCDLWQEKHFGLKVPFSVMVHYRFVCTGIWYWHTVQGARINPVVHNHKRIFFKLVFAYKSGISGMAGLDVEQSSIFFHCN